MRDLRRSRKFTCLFSRKKRFMQHTQFLLHKRHLSEHLTKIVSAATKVNPLSGPSKRFNATRLS